MDDLPADHDVIVVGTGMPESIVAAAVSRIGQRVLHLDKEAHYGGLWASYNLSSLREWMFAQNESLPPEPLAQTPLGPGERLILTSQNHTSVFNTKEIVNVPEKLADCPPAGPALLQLQTSSGENSAAEGPVHSASTESTTADDLVASCPCPYSADSTEHSSVVAADLVDSSGSDEPAVAVESEDVSAAYHTVASAGSSVDATYGSATQHTESISDGLNEETEEQDSRAKGSNSESASGREPEKVKELWSLEKLLNLSRKFNLDLAPKLLFSRGPLVELLISSNIARYAEFKALTRILTMHNGNLQQVPCSRADVFSCKNVTVVEKRMLMKFLAFCKEFEQHPDEYRGFEGRPFLEFLQSRQLSKNVEHYVLHAIAMVDGTTPTLQALKSVQKFLDSLGRYGNSPFLASLYGSGELPQCFCRLCAVYGGIYHLQRGPSALLVNEDGACIGIVSNGRRFNCRWVVMGASYAPAEISSSRDLQRVSRAIVISDESLHPAEKEQVTLLRLQRSDQLPRSVMVQEQGPGMMVCPPGLYVVHLTCPSVHETAEQDLAPAVKMLFDTTQSPQGEDKSKPKALYILYFNVEDTTQAPLNENCPPGLVLVSSPGPHLDYEHPVNEAREVFQRMYPNEEFLPRAPDPEEILLEHENNPGDHGLPTEERDGELTAAKTELGTGKEQIEKKGNEPESGKGDDINASKRVLATSNSGGATSSGDS
ncbi:rab proteins geranylgeranyltransferase component A 2 [Dermacentor albipictus]|uniref:rab proteins geranylgeranyltransferase component A 2 n=1 Tax=Dermacentor albipictus TaxID=60249 RepID=UPI0031FDB4B2